MKLNHKRLQIISGVTLPSFVADSGSYEEILESAINYIEDTGYAQITIFLNDENEAGVVVQGDTALAKQVSLSLQVGFDNIPQEVYENERMRLKSIPHLQRKIELLKKAGENKNERGVLCLVIEPAIAKSMLRNSLLKEGGSIDHLDSMPEEFLLFEYLAAFEVIFDLPFVEKINDALSLEKELAMFIKNVKTGQTLVMGHDANVVYKSADKDESKHIAQAHDLMAQGEDMNALMSSYQFRLQIQEYQYQHKISGMVDKEIEAEGFSKVYKMISENLIPVGPDLLIAKAQSKQILLDVFNYARENTNLQAFLIKENIGKAISNNFIFGENFSFVCLAADNIPDELSKYLSEKEMQNKILTLSFFDYEEKSRVKTLTQQIKIFDKRVEASLRKFNESQAM